MEWTGESMIALSAKTYFASGEDNGVKVACKGIQKDRNKHVLSKEAYLKVLTTGKLETAQNRGFRMKNGKMTTYQQQKVAISYSFWKRKVCDDGINTEPLDI